MNSQCDEAGWQDAAAPVSVLSAPVCRPRCACMSRPLLGRIRTAQGRVLPVDVLRNSGDVCQLRDAVIGQQQLLVRDIILLFERLYLVCEQTFKTKRVGTLERNIF